MTDNKFCDQDRLSSFETNKKQFTRIDFFISQFLDSKNLAALIWIVEDVGERNNSIKPYVFLGVRL